MLTLIDGGLKTMTTTITSSNKLFIYFDYKVSTTKLYLCVAGYKKEGSAVESFKKVTDTEAFSGWNNYHHTMKALILAIRTLNEQGITYSKYDIVMMNQNDRVFDWVLNEQCGADYEDLLNAVYAELAEMDVNSFSFRHCDGKTNRAKKMLSGVKVESGERQLNLDRFAKKTSKVLKFGG